MGDWNSEIMRKWDDARAYIANGGTGSWPRDWFESEIDARDDRIEQLEAQNAELQSALEHEKERKRKAVDDALAHLRQDKGER